MNNSWYSLSIGDIEKKLNTNAASGLSRKAARSRYIKGGRNDLFRIRRASISTCLKRVLSEPITLIMMAVLIIALIFDLKAQAASTFIILCVNLSMSIVAFIKADRIFEATARYSRPLARVVREGKLYYVDSEPVGDKTLSLSEVIKRTSQGEISPALKIRISPLTTVSEST